MAYPSVPLSSCNASLIPFPTLPNATITSLLASPITNYSTVITSAGNFNHPTIAITNASFCNITVTYTHTDHNDSINVESWLPLSNWNGRLQATGGSGWTAGRWIPSYWTMEGAIGEGYATSTTDAGLGYALYPDVWALTSLENVNANLLEDFASVSLNDQAIIAKDLIEGFYGQKAEYSYFSGCSGGGRQGLVLAQKYPDAYDGIAASSPAIDQPEFRIASAWAGLVMEWMGEVPWPCEFDFVTDKSVEVCDGVDGVVDGVIADPYACNFDPFALVGNEFNCSQTGKTMQLSKAAAIVANATWTGPSSSDGEFLWYGPNVGADLTGDIYENGQGWAQTSCSANATCVPVQQILFEYWVTYFIEKNATLFNSSLGLSHKEYDDILRASSQQYDSIFGSSDPDLSQFRDAGGKMITYHGLADGTVPTRGMQRYYDDVSSITPDVHDFYRFFEAPGIAHCSGGPGGQPITTFDAMRAWVENGIAPDTLPVAFNDTAGTLNERFLCPYPTRTLYNATCGDGTIAECFFCD